MKIFFLGLKGVLNGPYFLFFMNRLLQRNLEFFFNYLLLGFKTLYIGLFFI